MNIDFFDNAPEEIKSITVKTSFSFQKSQESNDSSRAMEKRTFFSRS